MMEVSLIVPVYNGENFLGETLPALLNQDFSEPHEIILINDGSSDSTKQILNSQEFPPHFSVIHHKENQGRAAARNTGIKISSGKILIFLDSDMIINPDFISTHYKAFEESSTVGFVGKITCPEDWMMTRFRKYLYIYHGRGPRKYSGGEIIPYKYFVFGNASVKREAVKAVGFFDEQISYGEDIDFAYRLHSLFPNKLRYLPEAVSYHLGHENLSNFLKVMYHFGNENIPYLLGKHPEMASILAADFAEKFDFRKDQFITGLKKLFGKLVFNHPFQNFLKKYAESLPYPLSNLSIRLCVVGSVVLGYKDFLKSEL